MINERKVRSYCCEDISLIENYDKAIKDDKMWHCHHLAEILPCGVFQKTDLLNFGLYFNRPAIELVFLPRHEHLSKHRQCLLTKTKVKISEKAKQRYSDKTTHPMFGKSQTESAKRLISDKKKGSHWYNNGEVSVMAKDCPEGFTPGRL